jgi:hypothetical protein
MSINFKPDKDQADVYDICRLESSKLSTEDIDGLLERGAVVHILISVSAGAPTYTRAALLGVVGIEGDIYADITVNGVAVERLAVEASHGQELRAWAAAFNTASRPNRAGSDSPV